MSMDIESPVHQIDLKELVLSNGSFGPHEIEQIRSTIASDYAQFSVLRDLAGELEATEERSPATSVRLGVGLFLLGRYHRACEVLSNADGGAVSHYYRGKSLFYLEKYSEAVEAYEQAKRAGYDSGFCDVAIAEAKRYNKEPEDALKILDELYGPIEQTAEYLYQRAATVAAVGSNPSEVVALYERAVELEPEHAGALFGLALENDRRGNDEKALELYAKSAASFPSHVGALLNLGVLYEDHNQFERAQRCFERILDVHPAHPEARLYFRDVVAAGGATVDPWEEREKEKMAQILKGPVADFELSVRSRNCLQKMNIRTIGDLTHVSEAELLASKNFGETSLIEIREMLSTKGVGIGQFAHEKRTDEEVDISDVPEDQRAMLERPIADLNLSVRARKCMNRLTMSTLGELCRKTQDDLLECKNFGVTSLNEVREKLEQLGLKLRGE